MTKDELLDDAFRCWEVAIAAIREKRVRAGEFEPLNGQEQRWAAEGPVPNNSRLETVRGG